MLNGLVVKWLIRRKYGTYKETKKTTNGFTKSYNEKTKTNKEKESEEIMPYHTGHGKKKKKKGKKSKMGKKKR